MGLFSRFVLLTRGKLSAALDRAEDPREVLEYGYQQQQRQLLAVKRSLVEVATARAQLGQRARKLHEQISAWTMQAGRALELGREDLARDSLQRKHAALAELEVLEAQVAEVGDEEARLGAAQRKLMLRIEEFAGRKGIVSARYASAQARVEAANALTGISGEMAELNLALGRAEAKTEQLQARAEALDELIESDVLALGWGSSDFVTQELRQLTSARSAEAELEELRRQLGPDAPTLSLGEGA
jgi:phage shock protein A